MAAAYTQLLTGAIALLLIVAVSLAANAQSPDMSSGTAQSRKPRRQ